MRRRRATISDQSSRHRVQRTPAPIGTTDRRAPIRAAASVCLLLFAVASAGCKVNAEDIETWQGTVKGPGKIVAVLQADKYDIDLRAKAALALVEMERQDVNGVQELQRALQGLEAETRTRLIDTMTPGLLELMKADAAEDDRAGPAPTSVRAKDAAFLLITHASDDARKKLTQGVINWYVRDFNGRSLAGDYSAEQVVRALGSSAAAQLIDAMDSKLPPQALVKVSELIGQVGAPAAKKRAAKRLVAIEKEMQSDEFLKWLKDKIRKQMKERGDEKIDEEQVDKVAELNRHNFLVEGALPAMKHLAAQDVVADRLLEIAQKNPVTERRKRALQALEGNARKKHLDALLELALDDENPAAVRDYAFDRVGDVGSSEAIEPMWPLVKSAEEPRLRWRAGELVLALGGRSVLEEVFAKLPDDAEYPPQELEGYATRTSQMSPLPDDFAKRLSRAPQWWKRVVAIKFFERKGDENDVDLLQRLTSDTSDVQGEGWKDDMKVGDVAKSSLKALRQRLGQPEDESQAATASK